MMIAAEVGIFAQGKIIDISDIDISVRFHVDGYLGDAYCKFPNVQHPSYTEWQWMRSGYLKKIFIKKCECRF